MSAFAKIHVAKKQLGMDEDDYRALLMRVTGKASSKEMDDAEHRAVLDEFGRLGFKPSSKASGTARKRLSGTYAGKAQALWIALFNLGAVDDRRDEALLAFVRRQTGIERTEWVFSPEHGQAVVEALKKMCEREGVDWNPKSAAAWTKRHGYQIASAQYDKLKAAGATSLEFWTEVAMVLADGAILGEGPTDNQWIAVMNSFGQRVRALKTDAV